MISGQAHEPKELKKSSTMLKTLAKEKRLRATYAAGRHEKVSPLPEEGSRREKKKKHADGIDPTNALQLCKSFFLNSHC
jgi:hypothetical protein